MLIQAGTLASITDGRILNVTTGLQTILLDGMVDSMGSKSGKCIKSIYLLSSSL